MQFTLLLLSSTAFSALMLLGSRKGIQPVKNWAVECRRSHLSGARCRLAYGPDDATATHYASVKSRLVLPFWYRLTWVGPDKGSLNGCVCVCVTFSNCWQLGTACIACSEGSMYVHLSRLTITFCCSRFAAVGPAARRYQPLAARQAVSSSHNAAAKCEQCHTISWCRKLNKEMLSNTHTHTPI